MNKTLGLVVAAALLLGLPAQAASSLTLESALGRALDSSPLIRQATLELEQANVLLAGANAERLSYGGELALGDRLGVSNVLSGSPLQAGNAALANGTAFVRVPIFTGFRLSHQIDQAGSGVAIARARLDATRQDLLFRVTEAFWEARRAELRARTQAEAVQQARQVRQVVRASFEVGRANASELDRAEVSLLNDESALLSALGEAESRRDALGALLGTDVSDVRLEDAPVVEAAFPAGPTLEQAIAVAEAESPGVRLAAGQLATQRAALGVAEAARYPQVDLLTAYQHGNNPFIATSQNRSVLDSFTGTWDARLNMSLNLFDHGAIGRAISRERLALDAAEAGLAEAKRQAALAVKQAYRRLTVAERRLALSGRSETLAAKNLHWLEGRFKFGYALMVELNEARMNLVTARNQQTDARIDHQLAKAALAQAMGRLVPPTRVGALTRPEGT